MPLDGTTWFTDTEREILRSVREQISKPGAWCQGNIGQRQSGPHCLLGWIFEEGRHHHGAVSTLRDKLGGWIGLIEVNDVPRGKPQVVIVAYLDRVITGARM